MNEVITIGTPIWSYNEIEKYLEEFLEIYKKRPIQDNQGGMKTPHMFAVWYIAKTIKPDLIVESGVWKGQSTWLLEQACPTAKIISIDLDLSTREYISNSPNVTYSDSDFDEQNWTSIPDNSLAFFDDHQNAYNRLKQCSWYGFKHTIFEDNYPVKQGDCYSLKKAFSGSGFNDSSHLKNYSFFQKVFSRLGGRDKITEVQPNNFDSNLLHKHLEIYSEFPPIFKSKYTRWSDEWEDKHYPTPPPVLTELENIDYKIYQEEAMFYTWICYAKLK
jgi:hypothetical protein